MIKEILSTIEPAVVTAAIGVVTAAVTGVGTMVVKFIQKKVEALQVKIGADTYQKNLTLAQSAWNIVDEDERISGLKKTIVEKQAAFAVQLEKMVPGLTGDEIVQFRQAVAGVVNQGKAAITETSADTQKATDQKAADTLNTVMNILNTAVATIAEIQPSSVDSTDHLVPSGSGETTPPADSVV